MKIAAFRGAGQPELAECRAPVLLYSIGKDKRARASQQAQRPRAIWFTGLSGSGKSTIANLVEQREVLPEHAAGLVLSKIAQTDADLG